MSRKHTYTAPTLNEHFAGQELTELEKKKENEYFISQSQVTSPVAAAFIARFTRAVVSCNSTLRNGISFSFPNLDSANSFQSKGSLRAAAHNGLFHTIDLRFSFYIHRRFLYDFGINKVALILSVQLGSKYYTQLPL